ncbi:PD-(D/E)XK nuclease family protein [uncultured Lactobacillus sp.]|uniref:PD-(D/E)XK nuclease family protein n=1 Tax=uncultured Lactobacillus sp. TaxID=153152 RepID=UPI002601D420|nr:PD-(D/E)XK nuclease family protein [uncultured Lactobacillus sp.]
MINIITGRQTDPLQNQILDLAVKKYYQDPSKKIFIIVPNHIKFTTEVRALSKLANLSNQNQVAVKNLQILSFSRLAWYFLKDAQIALPEILDDAASIMLLEQIVRQNQDKLKLFTDEQINQGSLKQLYQAILTLKQGSLDLDDIDVEDSDEETKLKIHDLKIVYEVFVERLANKFATKDEMQFILNQYLVKADLQNYSFYFSDFSHFTSQEQLTLQLLTKKAADITVSFKTKNGQVNTNPQAGDYDYIVQSSIKHFEHFLQTQNLNYTFSFYESGDTLDNKTKLNGVWTKTLSLKNDDIGDLVQFIKADSRYSEAYFVARTIYQQVALNNYRFRDFLILAPDLNEYETYLTPILRQNKIPFFDDLQKQMKFHPLVVIIENLMQIYQRGFQTNNLLSIMKTHLLMPEWYRDEASFQYDIDSLENFVLAHGINQNLWKKDLTDFLDAHVIALDESASRVQELDRVRSYFVNEITDLFDQLKSQKDPQRALSVFWNFLIKNGVAKRLENWRQKANEDGNLQLAQQPEQVWTTLNDLLKDYLLINEEFNIESFFQLLISGFSEASFSQIPSALDAVSISEMGMVQSNDYKQVFILGATSSNLPNIKKIPGFFTDENLDQINRSLDSNQQIENQNQMNNLDQNYQFGLALSLASDRIYISYPILNTENEELKPSIYYKQLFRQLEGKEYFQHDLPHKQNEVLSFITNAQASLGYLSFLQHENFAGADKLLDLTHCKIPSLTNQILLASDFKNIPISLDQKLAQELYGKNIETSVSQLETYYENSFEYFLNYGLSLRKRFENELDVVQAGNYYHETFDQLVKLLKDKHIDLASLTDSELSHLLEQIHEQMQEKGRYRQLLNDPFNKYLFRQLDQTTANVAKFWHRNIKKTIFRPAYSELSFGRNQPVKGLDFQVQTDLGINKIDLRGKMDRVDLAQLDNSVLGQVIDYKSSAKKFDLGLFANGISLQMISYLDVLKNNQHFFAQDEELDILGAFYQTVTKHIEKLNSDSNLTSDYHLKDIVKQNAQQLMYNGILVADQELLEKAEPNLSQDRASSELYEKIRKKANGDFSYPNLTSFSKDQLQQILAYNAYLIQHAAKNILSGKIDLNPYSYKNKTPLQYSDYTDIFFFDAMLKENNYHKIDSMDKKELLELIKNKLDQEKGN